MEEDAGVAMGLTKELDGGEELFQAEEAGSKEEYDEGATPLIGIGEEEARRGWDDVKAFPDEPTTPE